MSHPLLRADFDDEEREKALGFEEGKGGKQSPGFVTLYTFS